VEQINPQVLGEDDKMEELEKIKTNGKARSARA
jgi:hypothetical protein